MCIFCKIASGEIPCYKIYEDEDFLAFLDLSQATIGHTLVISKKHYSNIFELNEDTKIMEVVIKVAKALKESLEIENINILNNSGELAGQSVNHFHIHLIPRTKDDKIVFKFNENKLTKEEFQDLADKIKSKL